MVWTTALLFPNCALWENYPDPLNLGFLILKDDDIYSGRVLWRLSEATYFKCLRPSRNFTNISIVIHSEDRGRGNGIMIQEEFQEKSWGLCAQNLQQCFSIRGEHQNPLGHHLDVETSGPHPWVKTLGIRRTGMDTGGFWGQSEWRPRTRRNVSLRFPRQRTGQQRPSRWRRELGRQGCQFKSSNELEETRESSLQRRKEW